MQGVERHVEGAHDPDIAEDDQRAGERNDRQVPKRQMLRSAGFGPGTPLLGALPELDSMAVLAVVSGLESHFGITFRDDQLSGSRFATVGSLCELVQESLDADAA